jgi:hypothetical protein
MKSRVYTLPSTDGERLQLRTEVERDAAAVLGRVGFSVQERHRKTWAAMTMVQLRICAKVWRTTAERFSSLPPKQAVKSSPVTSSLFNAKE